MTEKHDNSKVFIDDTCMQKTKNLVQIALPAIFALFFSFVPELVNLHQVGQEGKAEEINGIALGNIILTILPFTVMWGFCGSLDTFLGQAFGAQDFDLAGHYLNAGKTLMVAVFLPMFGIVYFSETILVTFGQDSKSSYQAWLYLIYLTPGIFFMYQYDAQRRLLQQFKMVKLQAMICFISAVAHYILSYQFIREQNMGVIGAAIATNIAYFINFALANVVSRWNPILSRANVRLDFTQMRFRNLIRVGFFNMTMIGLKWWSFQYLILLAARISIIDQIAFNNLFNFSYLIITVATGISNAFSQIIASSIGAKQYERAKSYGKFVYQQGVPLALCFCIILQLSKRQISLFFGSDPLILQKMLDSFDLASISLFFDWFQQLQLSMIRAIGLYKLASFTNFMAYECVLIPFATITVIYFDASVYSLWVSLIVAYASVNTLYFFAIWGCNCSIKQFKKNQGILHSDDSYEVQQEKQKYMDDEALSKDLKRKLI
ncbi:na+-driven multidrug efflux pump [Stylonychia lemnae]|uniref:Na+-driven multidrug efflux pump n=1 Tax=Stylonychia lemnae TaxID=5949 RepID=A0A077ZZS7_STYLE|nr:na+-driven multidrug efflux pump [Stylonychia lemnae]|eukprot:CDW75127.1 na+-driven multidrug efflux pump [Stylonychia lemnae]